MRLWDISPSLTEWDVGSNPTRGTEKILSLIETFKKERKDCGAYFKGSHCKNLPFRLAFVAQWIEHRVSTPGCREFDPLRGHVEL